MSKDLVIIKRLKRSPAQLKVLSSIKEPSTPAEIMRKIYGKSSATYFAIVSRALTKLKNYKLIQLINKDDKVDRIYTLTKKGKELVKKLN